jgi:hypothetical protein
MKLMLNRVLLLVAANFYSCGVEGTVSDAKGTQAPAVASSPSGLTLASGGCQVFNSKCPNHPEYAGFWFADDVDNSGKSPFRCAQRSNEYRMWCGQTGTDDYTYSASIEVSTQART